MITFEQLKVYSKFGGDGDMIARIGNQLLTGEEWILITNLLQVLTIINNGYASEDFIAQLNRKLSEGFDNNETIKFLKTLAK
jgi:hypothetical protein